MPYRADDWLSLEELKTSLPEHALSVVRNAAKRKQDQRFLYLSQKSFFATWGAVVEVLQAVEIVPADVPRRTPLVGPGSAACVHFPASDPAKCKVPFGT